MTDEFPRPRNYHLMLVFHIDSTTPMAKRRFRSGCRSLRLLHVFLPHGNGHTRRWIWRKSYEFTMLPDCISTYYIHNICKHPQISESQQISKSKSGVNFSSSAVWFSSSWKIAGSSCAEGTQQGPPFSQSFFMQKNGG